MAARTLVKLFFDVAQLAAREHGVRDVDAQVIDVAQHVQTTTRSDTGSDSSPTSSSPGSPTASPSRGAGGAEAAGAEEAATRARPS